MTAIAKRRRFANFTFSPVHRKINCGISEIDSGFFEAWKMNNSVTVEVTRGNLVESRHHGLAIVVDGDGDVLFSAGDVDCGVFPRSACKAMQALPLVESGAADAYGFGDRELALACSSHSGEDEHVATAAGMLEKA